MPRSWLLCFPDLRQGPLGPVDPLYARVRLQNIIEIQPLVPPEWLSLRPRRRGPRAPDQGDRDRPVRAALPRDPAGPPVRGRPGASGRRSRSRCSCSCRSPSIRCAGRAMPRRSWSGPTPPASPGCSAACRPRRPARRGPAAAAGHPGGPVLAAACSRPPCPSRRSRAPVAPARSIAWRWSSIASAPAPQTLLAYADYGSELLYRTRAPRALDPQPSAAAGLRRDLPDPDLDRRAGRPGRAGALRRRLDPAVPERDRTVAVRGRPPRPEPPCTSASPTASRPTGSVRCRSRATSPPRRACSRSLGDDRADRRPPLAARRREIDHAPARR